MNTKALYRMWQGRKQVYVIPACKIEKGSKLYCIGHYKKTGIPVVNWQPEFSGNNAVISTAPCNMQPDIAYPVDEPVYITDYLEKCLALPAKEK